MGLLDLFSPPPPLEEKFKKALSSHYFEDASIIEKLARAQEKIASELVPNEEILYISYGYLIEGFGIITNKRVLRFNGKVVGQLAHSEIADIESRVHPNGYFLITLLGYEALPYKNFSFGDMGRSVQDIWTKNTIYLSMPKHQIQNEFIAFFEICKKLQ